MKKASLLLTTIFLVIIALAAFQVFVSNKLSTAGIQLSSLYKESQFYKEENEVLKMQVYSAFSIASISGRAREIGFVQASPLVIRKGAIVARK